MDKKPSSRLSNENSAIQFPASDTLRPIAHTQQSECSDSQGWFLQCRLLPQIRNSSRKHFGIIKATYSIRPKLQPCTYLISCGRFSSGFNWDIYFILLNENQIHLCRLWFRFFGIIQWNSSITATRCWSQGCLGDTNPPHLRSCIRLWWNRPEYSLLQPRHSIVHPFATNVNYTSATFSVGIFKNRTRSFTIPTTLIHDNPSAQTAKSGFFNAGYYPRSETLVRNTLVSSQQPSSIRP